MAEESDGADRNAALERRVAELEAALKASLSGSGAIAQDDGVALGERSLYVGGPNSAPLNSGTQVATNGGYFINGDLVQFVTTITQTGEDVEETKSVIALYLHALSADLAGLKLGEIDLSAEQARQTPLELADIYVPLDTTQRIPAETTLAQWLAHKGERVRESMESAKETQAVSALDALATHRELTLLGNPGSGKSTFGASVLLTLAQAWQGRAEALTSLRDQGPQGPLFPIRVILRRFAEQLPPDDKPARAGDLWRFIGEDLDASGYGLAADAVKIVQRIALKHGALILLDGLDECGDSAKRARVLPAVRDLMQKAGPRCRFILTARPYAWPGGPDPAKGVYALADLNDEQIEQFIRAWYAALAKRNWRSPGEAQRKMEDLLTARQRPDLLPLAHNPLLLTLMATLHSNRGRLPDDRADLYNESVDLLMLRWNRQIGADKALLDALGDANLKLTDLREALEQLAFEEHEKSVGQEGTADIGEDRLVRAFLPLLKGDRNKAAIVVDYIEKRAGLLVGQGEKDGEPRFTFPHRTFQEFLAACHLATRNDFAAECARLARAAPGHWQVVLPLAARLAKAERGASAADELIGGTAIADFKGRQPDAGDWARARLAGLQLVEIGRSAIDKSPRTRAIAKRVADWLVASLPVHPKDGGAPANQRAQAGDVLAALGDPRFDAERFYLPGDEMLGFEKVHADQEFVIGTRKADVKLVGKATGRDAHGDEINDETTPAPEFYISRYPVTVAQFAAFVAAKTLEDASFEIGDQDTLRDPATRPVCSVNWHEARAYCEWLNSALANAPWDNKVTQLVRTGRWQVALPSELEWERTARGSFSRTVFPWGDKPDPERANYDESGIGATSPVGCFAANSGVYDMAGNVWEWTRSLWGKDSGTPTFVYPYDLNDLDRENPNAADDVYRVVRGGSWGNDRYLARCAVRGWNEPDARRYFVGFRVVLRSAPASKL